MQLHLHIDCCSWKANSFWRPDDTQYFCADIRLGIVSINNSFLLYGNEGETCEAAAQCEFEEEERGKWEWQAEREVVNSARQYPILRKIERTTHSKQDGIQSNTLNGSALLLTKIWTNKRIGPLTNILYKESIKMELTKTWTNKRIEPLSWLDRPPLQLHSPHSYPSLRNSQREMSWWRSSNNRELSRQLHDWAEQAQGAGLCFLRWVGKKCSFQKGSQLNLIGCVMPKPLYEVSMWWG